MYPSTARAVPFVSPTSSKDGKAIFIDLFYSISRFFGLMHSFTMNATFNSKTNAQTQGAGLCRGKLTGGHNF